MILLVGLGNPGSEYAKSRHNAGFMIADAIVNEYNFDNWRQRFQGHLAKGKILDSPILCLKPNTYMNLSGQSVGEIARYFRIQPTNVIVIHDEIDLAAGEVRSKLGGGNAGHLGLESISAHIGSDFIRVRIGIGHPGRDQVPSYVLSNFSDADHSWLKNVIGVVAKHIALVTIERLSEFNSEVKQELQKLGLLKEKTNRNETDK